MAHVTFIHGILNKPDPEQLLKLWRRTLAEEDGYDLSTRGVTSTMVYWADVLYADPEAEAAEAESLGEEGLAVPADPEADTSLAWAQTLPADERRMVNGLAEKLNYDAVDEADPAPAGGGGPGLERIPLPGWLKKRIMANFLRDVHHYLYNVDHSPRPGARFRVQEEIRARFVKAVKEGSARPGPHLVMSHSMGTVVAYDCLKRVAECPRVDALMTIGSPLGLDEIQDGLQPEWSRLGGYPSDKVAKAWVNVYDPWDPVCGFDAKLANDYLRSGLPAVEDIEEPNWGKWRHDIAKYLRGPKLRERLRALLS
jgi:predicted alpha/beta hydrolase family esterase